MIVVALLLTVLAALGPSPRATVAADVAEAAGTAGLVTGRAFQESRRPGGPGDPVPDVEVLLLPGWQPLTDRLEEIKRNSRLDARALRTSAPDIDALLRAREEALRKDGSGDVVRKARTDGQGEFRLESIPPGPWLLVARRSTFTPKQPARLSRREREVHQPTPRLSGFQTVEIWLRQIDVAPDQTTVLDLTDRNVWMKAIEEERTTDAVR